MRIGPQGAPALSQAIGRLALQGAAGEAAPNVPGLRLSFPAAAGMGAWWALRRFRRTLGASQALIRDVLVGRHDHPPVWRLIDDGGRDLGPDLGPDGAGPFPDQSAGLVIRGHAFIIARGALSMALSAIWPCPAAWRALKPARAEGAAWRS